jgi:hypothetical protein
MLVTAGRRIRQSFPELWQQAHTAARRVLAGCIASTGVFTKFLQRRASMFKLRLMFSAALLLLATGAYAQKTNSFATGGNMHFDAKDMDTNGDNMITRDEMMKYGDKMWTMMAKDKDTIPVLEAAKDFARGGLNFNAKAMDTDHDGTISKDEFMAYAGKKFDKMKNADGMMSVSDAAKNFARGGNPHPHNASASKDSSSPEK